MRRRWGRRRWRRPEPRCRRSRSADALWTWGDRGAAAGLDADQLPRAARVGVLEQLLDNRLQILVEDFLLAVGQSLELLEDLVEPDVVQVVAQVHQAVAQRVPAGVLAQHQLRGGDADLLRVHDLVR